MTEYEIRITGVHYGANGDSVAGQKDTEEMHVRTRELLSRSTTCSSIISRKLQHSAASQRKQAEMANHVYELRQQVKTLQEEGKRIMESAKQEVERMIMYT